MSAIEGDGITDFKVGTTAPTSPTTNHAFVDTDEEAGDLALLDHVTPDELQLGAATDFIQTTESTTSTSWTDLSTTGPSVVLSVPNSGMVLVLFSSWININSTVQEAFVGLAVSGANSISPTTDVCVSHRPKTTDGAGTRGTHVLLTGLNPGSTTFRMKYEVTGATGDFRRRRLTVIPLG